MSAIRQLSSLHGRNATALIAAFLVSPRTARWKRTAPKTRLMPEPRVEFRQKRRPQERKADEADFGKPEQLHDGERDVVRPGFPRLGTRPTIRLKTHHQASRVESTNMRNTAERSPDGTDWLIWIPNEWNGVLLRNLASSTSSIVRVYAPRYENLLRRGYAFAGNARHSMRVLQYDPPT